MSFFNVLDRGQEFIEFCFEKIKKKDFVSINKEIYDVVFANLFRTRSFFIPEATVQSSTPSDDLPVNIPSVVSPSSSSPLGISSAAPVASGISDP